MRMNTTLLFAALLVASALVSGAALAQPTSTNSISLQAKLDGVAGPAASLEVQFWDDLASTDPSHKVGASILLINNPIANGIVSIPVSPIDPAIFNGQTRYMGIRVNGGAELSPRTLVTSVPYAMQSGNLYPTAFGNPRVVGRLRASSGFLAESADLYQTSFVGKFTQGYYPNWNATGREADFFPLIGMGYPMSGFGIAFGLDIVSPVIWMDSQVGNAFKVVSVDTDTTLPRDGHELFSVESNGTTRVRVLTITGGSDVAEPVAITPTAFIGAVQPGMVMVIDREHDGKLVPCTTAYDKAVAGVLSGANGLKPGMVLSAEGLEHASGGEGTMPLAMTGRVWVWCDATANPVRRGDSLTTSATPGHAMAVTDESKRAGAVIGKAMTELKDGKGLVLVLVNLQ